MKIETLEKKHNGYKLNDFSLDDIGDDHLFTGLETPLKVNMLPNLALIIHKLLFQILMNVQNPLLLAPSLKTAQIPWVASSVHAKTAS